MIIPIINTEEDLITEWVHRPEKLWYELWEENDMLLLAIHKVD